jgi:hypothetical protein
MSTQNSVNLNDCVNIKMSLLNKGKNVLVEMTHKNQIISTIISKGKKSVKLKRLHFLIVFTAKLRHSSENTVFSIL